MTKVELYKSRMFVTLIHLCALGQFIYGLHYSGFELEGSYKVKTSRLRAMIPEALPQKIKFLSYWCLIIQNLYYIVSLINDVVGTNEIVPKRPPPIRKFKDYLMASLAFPIALNVGITFWTLYAIDRELVLPKILDTVFPSWLNHVLHTNIVVFIVLELFTSYRAYPQRRYGLTGLAVFMLSYLVWIHIIKHYTGIWVYPVLEVLQLPQRIVFFAIVLAFTLGLYLLGEFINNTVWAKEHKLAQRKIK